MLNYDNRRFEPTDAGPDAAVGHYRQQGELVWADFGGEQVRAGRLVGLSDRSGVISAAYCQVLATGDVIAGTCVSTPTALPDGRLRLTEHWQRADGTCGISTIDELRLPPRPDGCTSIDRPVS